MRATVLQSVLPALMRGCSLLEAASNQRQEAPWAGSDRGSLQSEAEGAVGGVRQSHSIILKHDAGVLCCSRTSKLNPIQTDPPRPAGSRPVQWKPWQRYIDRSNGNLGNDTSTGPMETLATQRHRASIQDTPIHTTVVCVGASTSSSHKPRPSTNNTHFIGPEINVHCVVKEDHILEFI